MSGGGLGVEGAILDLDKCMERGGWQEKGVGRRKKCDFQGLFFVGMSPKGVVLICSAELRLIICVWLKVFSHSIWWETHDGHHWIWRDWGSWRLQSVNHWLNRRPLEIKFIVSLHLKKVIRSKHPTILQFSLTSVFTDIYAYIITNLYICVCIHLSSVICPWDYGGWEAQIQKSQRSKF